MFYLWYYTIVHFLETEMLIILSVTQYVRLLNKCIYIVVTVL